MYRLVLAALPLAGCYTFPELSLVDEIPIVGEDSCAPPLEVDAGCMIDGDTFDLGGCGTDSERVRMLGINAPELAHGGDPVECWGPEAADELRRLIGDRRVTLTFDQECQGVFGRTLAYVWLAPEDVDLADDEVADAEGAVLVNELLLSRGFVRLYDEEWVGDLRLQDRLDEAQAQAQARGLGLWSACENTR